MLDPEDYIGKSSPTYPSRLEIPEKYHDFENPHNVLAGKWFFEGVRGYSFEVRGSCPRDDVLKIIRSCLNDHSIEHSYKLALVAYMLDSFFTSIKNPMGMEIS